MTPNDPPLPFEPFKTKVVERIPNPTRRQREAALERAGFNLFNLHSDEVRIDLCKISGISSFWGQLLPLKQVPHPVQ